jgi:hypothetical protein
MTLQMPEIDSESQIAPTRLSLTSSWPQELLIGQLLRIVRACDNLVTRACDPWEGFNDKKPLIRLFLSYVCLLALFWMEYMRCRWLINKFHNSY